MSTSAHRTTSAGKRHRTVAELVARERTVPDPGEQHGRVSRRSAGQAGCDSDAGKRAEAASGTQRTHVTELLRREGGEHTAAPTALAEPPRQERSRTALAGRAAVLFGLTLGGMIGLHSTAVTPPENSPGSAGSHDVAAATPTVGPQANTAMAGSSARSAASTSTESEIELRDNETTLDQDAGRQQPAAGGAASESETRSNASATPGAPPDPGAGADEPAPGQQPQQGTDSANGEEGTSPDEQTGGQPRSSLAEQDGPVQDGPGQDNAASTGTARDDGAVQDEDAAQDEDASEAGNEAGGTEHDGLLSGILDPVTGTVSGVLDAGASLLGD